MLRLLLCLCRVGVGSARLRALGCNTSIMAAKRSASQIACDGTRQAHVTSPMPHAALYVGDEASDIGESVAKIACVSHSPPTTPTTPTTPAATTRATAATPAVTATHTVVAAPTPDTTHTPSHCSTSSTELTRCARNNSASNALPTSKRALSTTRAARKAKAPAHPVPSVMVWVGLGNPGSAYKHTRHNLGFMALDAVAAAKSLTWTKDRKCKAMTCSFETGGVKVHMLKPLTYMNLSGDAVRSFLRYAKPLANAETAQSKTGGGGSAAAARCVLAVCDDLDQPLGRMKLKLKGSAGGHNGLRSIEQRLASQEYMRLRLGIGPMAGRTTTAKRAVQDFVLTHFASDEQDALERVVAHARDALLLLTRENNLDKCMTAINDKASPFQVT
ncbi:peptidyl-tRNA hydrolase [Salpingoeca rosetta]|uniref:peptidyl-tRNA hydrolase n=1 Tax=Salpingoeca rosetta (strain ATCC 50818 / BSB-021) TaxID=946362 RepID=F2TZG4_SALR5|nr:peptidyl-tRNA hydrolase [Salpingoeca rosetta]EGD78988.1 peptidyl-tRNA hydrolase [Salpingoeca rosetta]|eukprot:XP_004997944.1 peptidyl-tRNA hydrolase [Salpingoeca rosetta]